MNLKKGHRKKVKKALDNRLTVSRITDPNNFAENGFSVYRSFYDRTRYSYRKDRIEKDVFFQWAQLIFCYPEVMVIGIYLGKELISIEISCLVNDVLILKESINSDKALELHASDLAYHFYQENASKQRDIKAIYAGFLLREKNINRFKIERGARVINMPAYLHVHPMLLWLLKIFTKNVYCRLKGVNNL